MIAKAKSLPENIFETIRDRIVFGTYPPGVNLPEKELCEEFGVSRTPLREAVLKLQDMKLVTVIPRFGTHVSPGKHRLTICVDNTVKLNLGPFVSALFGGMMAYCPAPEQLLPGFWKRAPWERAVTKRVLTVTSTIPSSSASVTVLIHLATRVAWS